MNKLDSQAHKILVDIYEKFKRCSEFSISSPDYDKNMIDYFVSKGLLERIDASTLSGWMYIIRPTYNGKLVSTNSRDISQENDIISDGANMSASKGLEQMINDDIKICESFLQKPLNQETGTDIYIDITGKYDGVINGFGNGLYQYYPEQHFYEPDISLDALIHNLKVLLGKMKIYQATHYPILQANTKKDDDRKTLKMYDVFISHANKDKEQYVDELKESLEKLCINIFYDKDTLEWGDKWKDRIIEGVEKAEFAIIVISDNFFDREWTEKELNDFLARQNASGQKIILPILHNITVQQLQKKYPAVADIQAIDSSKYSCDEIAFKFAGQLIRRLKG